LLAWQQAERLLHACDAALVQTQRCICIFALHAAFIIMHCLNMLLLLLLLRAAVGLLLCAQG
jgi:hypothetical protein